MKIYLGTDHAGFELKEKIKAYLKTQEHHVEDQGAFELNPADDYPDFIKVVATLVAAEPESRGIIFGGSGQGEAMCANRYLHVRATVFYGGSLEVVKLAREHNNANILSIGARFISFDETKAAIDLWLATPFSGADRHVRRNVKLDTREIDGVI